MTMLPIANERKTAMKKTMMAAMVAALVCVAVVLGIYPADRTVWCVEMVWAVGLWAILLLTRRRTSSATPLARSALRDSSSGAIGEILFIGRTSFQMALQFLILKPTRRRCSGSLAAGFLLRMQLYAR